MKAKKTKNQLKKKREKKIEEIKPTDKPAEELTEAKDPPPGGPGGR